jgi:hypothetical protein
MPRVGFNSILHLLAVPLSAMAGSQLNAPARTVTVTNQSQLLLACQTAEPNDVVLVAAGTYTLKRSGIKVFNRPGPVLVRGATGNPADVIIEGLGQDAEPVAVVFDLDESPRWTFQDLTTRNSYYHGFKFNGNSSDCVLRRVIMRDHGESGVKGTSDPKLGRYPDRLLVEGCDIGFSSARGGTRTVVEGIDGVGVQDWIIRHNRFVHITGKSGPAYAVFTKGNSSDTIIEGNRFEDCFIGASFGGGGTGAPYFRNHHRDYEHRGGVIRNNVFVRCQDAAIYLNKAKGARIYNNTVFESVLTIQLRWRESSAWIANNLVAPAPANPDEPPIRLRDGARLLSNYSNRVASAFEFVRGLGANPQLDLHLKPAGPAVDAGTPLVTDVTTDIDGQPRPYGKAIDVGADEWTPQ